MPFRLIAVTTPTNRPIVVAWAMGVTNNDWTLTPDSLRCTQGDAFPSLVEEALYRPNQNLFSLSQGLYSSAVKSASASRPKLSIPPFFVDQNQNVTILSNENHRFSKR